MTNTATNTTRGTANSKLWRGVLYIIAVVAGWFLIEAALYLLKPVGTPLEATTNFITHAEYLAILSLFILSIEIGLMRAEHKGVTKPQNRYRHIVILAGTLPVIGLSVVQYFGSHDDTEATSTAILSGIAAALVLMAIVPGLRRAKPAAA